MGAPTCGSSARKQEALRDYDEALRLDPRRALARASRGWTRSALGDVAGAREDWQVAVDVAPLDAAAWSNLAEAQRRLGDLDQALACAERALRLQPELAGAWLTRGDVLRDRGDLERAAADYGRCLELDPRMGLALNNRAAVRQRLGDIDGAEADLRAAVDHGPPLLQARLNLGTVLVARGSDPARALSELLAARASEVATSAEWRAVGVRAFERGWLAHAELAFDAALSRAPADGVAELRVWRAYCHELRGERAQAVEQLRTARPRPWAAIWLAELAGDAAGLEAAASGEGWPAPVAAFLAGRLGPEELLAAARAAGPAQEGTARFHLARAAEARGDDAAAREHFAACARLAPPASLHQPLAQRWLEEHR